MVSALEGRRVRPLAKQGDNLIFGKTPATVTAETALQGNDAELAITNQHAVLNTPLKPPFPEGLETIYFAMGCFWGSERIYWQIPGVYSTAVGYMGGFTKNSTYEQACSGRTGHTETVQVVYDPTKVTLDQLFKAFWENHDPTTLNRQGNDVGTQYRSAIFTTTADQHKAALASAGAYQESLASSGFGQITTEILPREQAGDGVFYYAEDYHQGYLHKNPRGYCNHGFCQVSYSAS